MIKNWNDLNIGDKIHYFKVTESNLYKTYQSMKFFDEVIVGQISTDTVIDKFNLSKIELEEFGEMEFSENDLMRNSDVVNCEEDDSMIILATSTTGFKNELEKIFLRFEIKPKINQN